MTKNELETVLSLPELKFESEDSLFDFICSLGPGYYFQYLSVQKVRELIEKIGNYFISFHKKLQHSIYDRLTLEPAESKEKENPHLVRPEASAIVCDKSQNRIRTTATKSMQKQRKLLMETFDIYSKNYKITTSSLVIKKALSL